MDSFCLAQAYQVLSNPMSRAEYDRKLVEKSGDVKTKAVVDARRKQEEEEEKKAEEEKKRANLPRQASDGGIDKSDMEALTASASSTTLFKPESSENMQDAAEYNDYLQVRMCVCAAG